MILKNFLNIAFCLFVLSKSYESHVELTSDQIRPTDIVYKMTTEDTEVDEYRDYSNYKTKTKKIATIPDEVFLNPANGSDAVVSNPKNPLEIIIIKRPDNKLGLPGGYNRIGEDPLEGLIRKFKSKVNFKVGQDQIIAEPLPGYIGNPEILKLKKVNRFAGPFMGVFGLPARDKKRNVIASLYHLIVNEKYTNPVPTGEPFSKDAFYCDVLKLLARNIDKITDDLNSHPLKAKVTEILENDKKEMANKNNMEMGDIDKCAQKFGIDYLNMINIYYLFLIDKKIINADGSKGRNYERYEWMYNKTTLLDKVKNNRLVL